MNIYRLHVHSDSLAWQYRSHDDTACILVLTTCMTILLAYWFWLLAWRYRLHIGSNHLHDDTACILVLTTCMMIPLAYWFWQLAWWYRLHVRSFIPLACSFIHTACILVLTACMTIHTACIFVLTACFGTKNTPVQNICWIIIQWFWCRCSDIV